MPLGGAMGQLPVFVIPMLLGMALVCGLVLRFQHRLKLRDLLRPRVPAGEWRRVLIVYSVAIVFLSLLLWWIDRSAMFSLVRQHTGLWVLIMVGYPLLSVFPQELIYRAYFFERYQPLFGGSYGMVLASAVFFSFGHAVFHNWVAVALTFPAGLIFGRTYQRTSSLTVVCVEHGLYGCAAFTIGYGKYFFDHSLHLYR